MEASSTTVNIQPIQPVASVDTPPPVAQSHKGRPRKTRAKSEARQPAVTNDAMQELVAIMLRKEAAAIQKEEDDAAKRQAAREQMLTVAREQERQKRAREANCSHVKENTRSAIAAGQLHNDGFLHPFCMRCFKTFPKRRPTHEEMPTAAEV